MKLANYFLAIALSTVSLWAQVTINQASGWLESASVEWKPVSGATSYNVYYTGGGLTNQKLDDQLIRKYGTYYRADAIGLKAGSYTLKVAPVTSGVEGTATTTSAVTVLAHDRTGFAFANGRVPGAYNADGTPKSGAVVLYVTENTKNTVSLTVTGATANPCVGLQTILDAFKKGKENRPLIVRFVGQVKDPSYLYDGDLVVENANNALSFITLEGVGEDATIDGWGIRLKGASNIEIRNVGIMNVNSGEGDNVGLQQANEYVWVHNTDFFYGDAGSDPDQVKGDGALDCKKSIFVTFSYNHFWDSGKSNLIGLKDEAGMPNLYITFHHNWYDHSDSRHPRLRFYSAHVYNNYYDGNSKYGVGSTMASSVYVEANYFRNCKYPMLIAMQGSDVWSDTKNANDYSTGGTFSSEDGGIIKSFNNYIEGATRFVPYSASALVDFDAYVASSRSATVPSTVKSYKGANVYNNFDTNPSIMYAYTADSAAAAKTKVMTYAGRVSGGDFAWTFTNADDASYLVNQPLKDALVAYTTTLVSIQGDGNGNGGTVPVVSSSSGISSSSVNLSSTGNTSSSSGTVIVSSSGSTIAGDIVHNYTVSGTTSTYFTITGNLSTSKGTVSYSGLTLTQCLKLETATQISFNLNQEATLTLVLNADFVGGINIDGASATATAGIVTKKLAAGSHVITKGDAGNLFYMSIAFAQQIPSRNISALSMSVDPIFYDAKSHQIALLDGYAVRSIQVYSPTGAVVQQERFASNTLTLANTMPGLRLVVVQTNRGVFMKSILVE